MALAPRGFLFLTAIPFIALWGIAGPAMRSLMSQRVDHTAQGKLQGAINSLRSITGMAGPPLFTQVFAFSITSATTLHLPGAPYFLAAILLTLSLVIAVFVARAHANSPAHVPLPPQEPEALS
jgi:DHA1 family tetracycline resistance protein-like MFS transporter